MIFSSRTLQQYLQNTTDPELPYVFSIEDWIAFVGLWLASIFTVVGNTLVILSFVRDKKLRDKPSNLFLLALAMTDLFTGLVSLPLDNMWRLRDAWPYGRTVCALWTFADYTVTVQSAYIISLISADRYFLVSKGLHYKFFQTRRRVLMQLGGTLFVSVVFHFCAIVGFDDTDHVDFEEECELNGLGALSYVILALILEFIIPLLVVCFFNLAIYLRIRRRVSRPVANASPDINKAVSTKRLINQSLNKPHLNAIHPSTSEELTEFETIELSSSSRPSKDGVDQTPSLLGVDISRNDQKPSPQVSPVKSVKHRPIGRKANTRKSSKRAAKTLSVLIVVFIVCWLPYNVVTIIRNISSDLVTIRIWDLVNYLLWLNSAVNPVLYAATNVQFRQNFCELLEKLFKPFKRLLCIK